MESLDHDNFVEEEQELVHDESRSPSEPKTCLSKLIRILFGLNGFSLSLEQLALMYVVDTQVHLQLKYLPLYGAVAFLPYSFKSTYGYLSQGKARHKLFAMLLIGNSICLIWTSFISSNGIFLLFFLAFMRGITDSWAELLLGLTLIDQAKQYTVDNQNHFQNYNSLASHFQAQAATMRNLGSLLGTLLTALITYLILRGDRTFSIGTELGRGISNTLLISTAVFQMMGACASLLYKENFEAPTKSNTRFQPINQNDDEPSVADVEDSASWEDDPSFSPLAIDEEQEDDEDDIDQALSDTLSDLSGQARSTRHSSRLNWALMGLLQLLLVVLAFQKIILDEISPPALNLIFFSLLLGLIVTAFVTWKSNHWAKSHQVGLFLILRSAIPSEKMILSFFLYSLFKSTPLKYQIIYMICLLMNALASWSYERFWSRYSSGSPFVMVIAGTTVLASLVSLSNMLVVNSSSSQYIFLIAASAQAASYFFNEWAFLPHVVLATTSLSLSRDSNRHRNEENGSKFDAEYGSLVSCLDFGDQIGALLTGLIIAMLDINRLNNWHNLDKLILICSVARIVSLVLLKLLPKQTNQ